MPTAIDQALMECERVLAMAKKLLGGVSAAGVDIAGCKLIAIENLIGEADGEVWRLTFKQRHLLPADPNAMPIGAGGEIFVTIDRTHGCVKSLKYGE